MLGDTTLAFVGVQELWPIALIVVVLFGAKKLPEMAKGLGEGMKEFKKAVREVNDDEPAPVAKSEASSEINKPAA